MHAAFKLTLRWWVAGPVISVVIVALLMVANKRFGVVRTTLSAGEGCPSLSLEAGYLEKRPRPK